MKSVLKLSVTVLISLFIVVVFLNRPDSEPRFNPSANPAYIPQPGDSFDFYIAENRRRIDQSLEEYYFDSRPDPFGAAYTREDVLNMRSPYQINPSPEQCSGLDGTESTGFLMVHGLSDSPYLLKRVAESIASEYPCALIRGLLSPGHSTVPGDLLNVRREDWYQTFAFGVSGFFNLVESLYVVGYSNGSVLALNYLDRNRDSAAISGLILLSPGLKTRDTRAFLSPWLKYGWKWINQSPDQDAVKYESFPMSAAAEFYHLTEDVTRAGFGSLSLPVLMVVSGDDTTIDNQYSVDFFCNKLDADSRKMIWYQSGLGSGNPEGICSGIELIPPAQTDRFISYSHVAITMPPTDPHYGMDGNYSACLTYTSEPDIFLRCREDNAATVYAENSYLDEARSFAGKLVRRTTFNPAYNEMISEISCFVNSDCTEEESSR